MAFPYKGKQFTRKQFEFVVQVCIASYIDMITDMIPGRYLAEDKKKWKRSVKQEMPSKKAVKSVIAYGLTQLGWNLSIFFAQISNDGMGVGDALGTADLVEELEQWSLDWLRGKVGIENNAGKMQLPDNEELAKRWSDKIWPCVYEHDTPEASGAQI